MDTHGEALMIRSFCFKVLTNARIGVKEPRSQGVKDQPGTSVVKGSRVTYPLTPQQKMIGLVKLGCRAVQ